MYGNCASMELLGYRNAMAINFYCWHGDVQVVATPPTAASLSRVVEVPSGGVSDS